MPFFEAKLSIFEILDGLPTIEAEIVFWNLSRFIMSKDILFLTRLKKI